MKKYPIKFTKNWIEIEQIAKRNPTDLFWIRELRENQDGLELCKKWKGKKITILELEQLITEFKQVVFDGKTIEVYNDYREG